MRKMKSVSSLKKRMRKTGGGKYVHARGGTSHNNAHKSRSRKRRLRLPAVVNNTAAKRLKTLLPYA